MRVSFICPEERETDSGWSDSESDSEDVSRLVVDNVQEGAILAPAYHFAPCYCFRDNVYQEMGLLFIVEKILDSLKVYILPVEVYKSAKISRKRIIF